MDTEHLKMILDTLKDVSHGALAFGILYIVLYFLLPILMALIIVRGVRAAWAKMWESLATAREMKRDAVRRDSDIDDMLRQLYDIAGRGRFLIGHDTRMVVIAFKKAKMELDAAEKLPPSEKMAKWRELGYYTP